MGWPDIQSHVYEVPSEFDLTLSLTHRDAMFNGFMFLIKRIVAAVVAGVFMALPSAAQQMQLEVTSDKDVYEYGEVIHIRSTLTNVSDSSYVYRGSSSCIMVLRSFGDYELMPICTADDAHIHFAPGDAVTFVWPIDPQVLGLPRTDGEHTIRVFAQEGGDSTRVKAPKYHGGRLFIRFTEGLAEAEIETIAESVGRTEVIFETSYAVLWQIEGGDVDSTAAALRDDPRIEAAEVDREYPHQETSFHLDTDAFETRPLMLRQNYPNPFAASTVIEFELDNMVDVRLDVFDALGRHVHTLADGHRSPGRHIVTLEAGQLAAGVYTYRLQTGQHVKTRQMVVLR